MYKLSDDKKYLDESFFAAKVLTEQQNEKGGWVSNPDMCALAGMSHGASGIIYALAKVNYYKADKQVLLSIEKGLNFEKNLYDDIYNNWKDERYYKGKKISESNNFTVAWCHGAPGILLSRLRLLELLKGEKYEGLMIYT